MTRRALVTVASLTVALAAACEERADERPLGARERERIESFSPLPPLPASPGNPVADDEAAAELGRELFFEARWSGDGVTSCASCHDPRREYTDGRAVALARGRTRRNTPSLRGSAWMRWQTWDGRKDSVWAQSLAPLETDAEHGSSRTAVARVVALHHSERWEQVFGALPPTLEADRLPPAARPVPDAPGHPHSRAWAAMPPEQRAAVDRVFTRVGHALEAYVRRLHPGEAPIDRYVRAVRDGDATGGGALSAAAVRGLRAFVGPAGCFDCHHGPLASDGEFHNLGLPSAIGVPPDELGRADGAAALMADPRRCGGRRSCPELTHLDPSLPELRGAFRTPTLRNVARTAPYMHGGHFETLGEVVDFYRTLPGGAVVGHRDGVLRPLPRSVRRDDLVAFLEALSGAPPAPRWLQPAERSSE